MTRSSVNSVRWQGTIPYRPGELAGQRFFAARPSAATALAIAAFFVLPVALVPSERGGLVHLPWVPTVWWTNWLIVVFAVSIIFFRGIGVYTRPIPRSTWLAFLLPILLLGIWQAISISWNGHDGFAQAFSLFESVAMCSAVTAGVFVCSGLELRTRFRFCRGLTLLVSAVAAVYMGLSFVFPGWRPSASWLERTSDNLGFIRVFGPLGTATTLNFILLPALGVSLGCVFHRDWGRAFWGVVAAFLCLAILSTGSRGAIMSLGVFFILLLLALRVRAVLVILPAAFLLVGLVAFVGVPERLRNFEDQARTETYRTGFRAYSDNLGNIVVGTGHGALYSKLHDDSLRKLQRKSRWYLLAGETQYGYSLRNSHSAILRSLVETGPLGFLLLLFPLCWLTYRLVSARYHRPRIPGNLLASSTLAGCVAVIPYMALEDFFSAYWPVAIWSMFAIIGAETAADTIGATESARRGAYASVSVRS